MFKRDRHNTVKRLLDRFDNDALHKVQAVFSGGTALALLLGEYRESVDVDFLISSKDGYRALRQMVWDRGMESLLPGVPLRGNLRADRYGVRAFAVMDETPVKVEFVAEGRVSLLPSSETICGVQALSREDFYVEKLLANQDRCMDRSVHGRDAIDLAAMIHHWGAIPRPAWRRVDDAYGQGVCQDALRKATAMLQDEQYRTTCLAALKMAAEDEAWILPALRNAAPAMHASKTSRAPRL